jgi:hypothetical protein
LWRSHFEQRVRIEEVIMADYSFDGRRLVKKSSGQKLAEIDGTTIRYYNGAVFGEIQGRNIRDSHAKKVAEFDGKMLKDDKGTKVIGIKDLQEIVEGEAGVALAAMWLFFVKGRRDHAGVL